MATVNEKIKENTTTTNTMFDLSEKCIMQFMLQHTNVTPDVLFITYNALNNKTVPLVLNPITSYSNNILVLSIEIVPHDYVCNIPPILLQNEIINNIIGFIYHSVITVHNTILSTNIKDTFTQTMIDDSMHLEMDDNKLSMFPIYLFPARRKEFMFLQMKDDLEKVLQQCSANGIHNDETKKQMQDIQVQYNELMQHLQNITYDKTIADTAEKDKNIEWFTHNRIGITFTEISPDKIKEISQ